jgi:uncharacterized membrane protein (TIGR01666 family)
MAIDSVAFKKFVSGHHVSTGIRITVCVLLPALLLYHYGMLGVMMGIPLGALFVALSDQPGPLHHRTNGMIAAILINFIVVCVAGVSAHMPWLIFTEIIVFSFLFSMFGVYGARADAIGLIALIAFIIFYGTQPLSKQSFLETAFYFSAGGAWYALFSLVTNTIQPYRPAIQSLGEYLAEIGHYLRERAAFYDKGTDNHSVLTRLIPHQVNIQQQQGALRELLFKTRLFLKQPTNRGRRIMMMFIESTDLLERIITAQQDYRKLHDDFDDNDILAHYKQAIVTLADSLIHAGLAVQNGQSYNNAVTIDAAVEDCSKYFFTLRTQGLNAGNVAAFIRLRHVLYSIEDVAERIKRIQEFTYPDAKISRQVGKEDVDPFTQHQDFNKSLFFSNLSLRSSQFRHALRLTIAMVAGFILSQVLGFGHGYWLLLSIASILKPTFSTSRKRNFERVIGTLAGAAMAFVTLHFAQSDTPIFVVMLLSMLLAYTFIRFNNLVSSGFITLYVVLSFHFLYPAGAGTALTDRVIDTFAGAVISFLAAYLVFPVWEHKHLRQLLAEAVKRNNEYFSAVTKLFMSGDAPIILEYKLKRKATFLALANVSDSLQRMLSEPKNQQRNLQQYHQLVTASHMLTSYIASLAYYAEQHRPRYESSDFKPMMQYICRQFASLQQLAEEPSTIIGARDSFPVNKKLKELIAKRKSELETSTNHSATGKTVSFMKSITDQLQLVNAAIEDMMKVLMVMDTQVSGI